MKNNQQEFLKNKAHSLPETPGIYKMYNQNREIIYIGKAVNLKRRVTSYFLNLADREPRKKALVYQIHNFEIENVDTELDALLLECQMIHKHRPFYNVLLNHFEKYCYFTIKERLHLTTDLDQKLLFGPYNRHGLVEKVLNILNNLYFKDLNSWYYQIRVFNPSNIRIPPSAAQKELIDFF